MADDLQHGINEACIFFYKNAKFDESEVEEVRVRLRQATPTLMLGIDYLIGKNRLRYTGDQHYLPNEAGYAYYKSLIENGDIMEQNNG